MLRYINYLKYVLKHKYFVYLSWLKFKKLFPETQVNLAQIIWHDWDKFLPQSFIAYAKTFYQPNGNGQYNETVEFNHSWNFHQKINKHHWQYWALIMDSGTIFPLSMPDKYIDEMLIDWLGASWAIHGSPDLLIHWYNRTLDDKKKFFNPVILKGINHKMKVLFPNG